MQWYKWGTGLPYKTKHHSQCLIYIYFNFPTCMYDISKIVYKTKIMVTISSLRVYQIELLCESDPSFNSVHICWESNWIYSGWFKSAATPFCIALSNEKLACKQTCNVIETLWQSITDFGNNNFKMVWTVCNLPGNFAANGMCSDGSIKVISPHTNWT